MRNGSKVHQYFVFFREYSKDRLEESSIFIRQSPVTYSRYANVQEYWVVALEFLNP